MQGVVIKWKINLEWDSRCLRVFFKRWDSALFQMWPTGHPLVCVVGA